MLYVLALSLALATPPRAAAPAVRADTARADDDLRLTVLRNARDVRRCYEREGLRRNSGLRGDVEVELTILPTGVVEHVDVTPLGLAGDGTREVALCIATAARNWRFERGPFQVETVVFPFHFAPDPPQVSSFASEE